MRFLFIFSTLAILAILAACSGGGDPAPTDGPDPSTDLFPHIDLQTGNCTSCQGCCLGTSCMPGTGTSACGLGGGPCKTCNTGDSCTMGVCATPKCDATTCASGCCTSAGKCEKGDTDSACGAGAATCAKCKSSESCQKGICTPNASAMYQVILEKGEAVSYNCDTFGKCDLYVKLTIGATQATSNTIDNNDKPVWNQTLLTVTGGSIMSSFLAEVMDDDLIDEKLGDCKPKVTAADLTAGTITTDCGKYTGMGFLKTAIMTFKFKPL